MLDHPHRRPGLRHHRRARLRLRRRRLRPGQGRSSAPRRSPSAAPTPHRARRRATGADPDEAPQADPQDPEGPGEAAAQGDRQPGARSCSRPACAQRHAVLDRLRRARRRCCSAVPAVSGVKPLIGAGPRLRRRPRPAALGAGLPGQAPRQEVHRRLPRRHRHHRARHQVGPAGARLPEDHRQARAPEPLAARVPPPGREHRHGHGHRSGAGQDVRAHADRRSCASSPSCWPSSRRPAATWPRRWATCRPCCARAS